MRCRIRGENIVAGVAASGRHLKIFRARLKVRVMIRVKDMARLGLVLGFESGLGLGPAGDPEPHTFTHSVTLLTYPNHIAPLLTLLTYPNRIALLLTLTLTCIQEGLRRVACPELPATLKMAKLLLYDLDEEA